MADRPRGRGRGRGRSQEQQSGQPAQPRPQQRGPAPQQPQQRGPTPQQSAWGQPKPQQQQPQGAQGAWATGRPIQQQAAPPPGGSAWGPRPGGSQTQQPPRQQQQPAGRASTRGTAAEITEAVQRIDIGGAGDVAEAAAVVPSGRGAVRGRRNQVALEMYRTRPAHTDTTKCGTTGQVVKLTANYFEIRRTDQWCLYQYRVDISPEEDVTSVRKALLRAGSQSFGGYIFDGTVMYTSHRLNPDPLEFFAEYKGVQKQVKIKLVANLQQGDYHYLQFYNILMRKCLEYLKLQLVGRDYFDPSARIDIPEHKMELWPGYKTSIRQHEQKVLMVAEITHKVMRNETVLDVLRDCYQQKTDVRKNFQQRVVGGIVLTRYNNRTYRIDDVDWNVTPKSSFNMRDNQAITYQDYYQQKYREKITDTNQPMLVSRAKPREIRAGMQELVYLVPELCCMTGLTDSQRANFHLMKALAQYTRVAPSGRIDKLNKFCQRLIREEKCMKEFKDWDMSLATKLVELNGRILNPEDIYQTESIRYSAGPTADWTRNLRNNPMAVSKDVKMWACVCPRSLKDSAKGFVTALINAAKGMKFYLPFPKLQEIPDDRVPNYLEGLETAINQYKPECILCIVSNNKLDRYSAIKKKCCVDRAVPTQVILAKNLTSKGLMSIATKVAIQINCKLGGAPWTVAFPISGLMVIGFDVCHDTMNKSKSYGAMVASLNKNVTRYYSSVSAHSTGDEMSKDFSMQIVTAVRKYQEINGSIPERIVIFRDGVGDGQIRWVHETEVKNIEIELRKIYGGALKMCFVIVSKRINTRFFLRDQNPSPGTVVDDVVTLPERYDYFVVSQSVNQGTVSPTSYNVVHDTSGLDPDKIQRLTYKLCHLYYNWSGTTRVPAPCQYAHKLAFLAGQALHREPNPALNTTLYFL